MEEFRAKKFALLRWWPFQLLRLRRSSSAESANSEEGVNPQPSGAVALQTR
jgi:hypothetical protein